MEHSSPGTRHGQSSRNSIEVSITRYDPNALGAWAPAHCCYSATSRPGGAASATDLWRAQVVCARLGVVFRSLLVSAHLGPEADFWNGYYGECELEGKLVLDPFVGGGTSVVEARRLGASCIGVDVDPVACAVTSLELDAWDMPALDDALEQLQQSVGSKLRKYHVHTLPSGESLEGPASFLGADPQLPTVPLSHSCSSALCSC